MLVSIDGACRSRETSPPTKIKQLLDCKIPLFPWQFMCLYVSSVCAYVWLSVCALARCNGRQDFFCGHKVLTWLKSILCGPNVQSVVGFCFSFKDKDSIQGLKLSLIGFSGYQRSLKFKANNLPFTKITLESVQKSCFSLLFWEVQQKEKVQRILFTFITT